MKTRVTNVRFGKDAYDVYCGRGSIWGNPFTHMKGKTQAQFIVGSRDEAVDRYREWIKTQPQLLEKLPELRNKVLSCYCWPNSCHCDILVEMLEEMFPEDKGIV